jgi:hypothetical protein
MSIPFNIPANNSEWSNALNEWCSTSRGLAISSGLTSVEYLQTFPNPCTIPPACFYNIQGLANYLNQNPHLKTPFSFVDAFKFLFPPYYAEILSTFNIPGYSTINVPLCSNVQSLSQNQARKYNQELQLFQKVYSINSNAYINYLTTGIGPKYYTFKTNQERTDMNSAVALVNKLYPFSDMAQAMGWQVPFPLS